MPDRDRADLQDRLADEELTCPPQGTPPAEAGVQLGDVAIGGRRFVTSTLPTGPRPPPGRCSKPQFYRITGNVTRDPAQTFCVAFT